MLAAVSCVGGLVARPRARGAGSAPRRVVVAAAVQSAGAAFPIGSRVRVKDSITVYHVPKMKTGIALLASAPTVALPPRGARRS